MQTSFHIIVCNGFFMNFSIRGSSAWRLRVRMHVTALDIQVRLRNPTPCWRTAWRQWKCSIWFCYNRHFPSSISQVHSGLVLNGLTEKQEHTNSIKKRWAKNTEQDKRSHMVSRHLLQRQLLLRWYLQQQRVRVRVMTGFWVRGRVRVKIRIRVRVKNFKIRIRVRVGVMFNVRVNRRSNCRRSKCHTFSHIPPLPHALSIPASALGRLLGWTWRWCSGEIWEAAVCRSGLYCPLSPPPLLHLPPHHPHHHALW